MIESIIEWSIPESNILKICSVNIKKYEPKTKQYAVKVLIEP